MMKQIAAIWLLLAAGMAEAFDHTHSTWDALLKRHVVVVGEGNASRVSYTGMLADRATLNDYLAQLSAVTRDAYQGWNRERQLAFLINAYNAFTVELILTRYPDVESIKDLGSLFRSPWKRQFFTLLGERRHLDNLEQDMIRAPGVFDEPRIHFALSMWPMARFGYRRSSIGTKKILPVRGVRQADSNTSSRITPNSSMINRIVAAACILGTTAATFSTTTGA